MQALHPKADFLLVKEALRVGHPEKEDDDCAPGKEQWANLFDRERGEERQR